MGSLTTSPDRIVDHQTSESQPASSRWSETPGRRRSARANDWATEYITKTKVTMNVCTHTCTMQVCVHSN